MVLVPGWAGPCEEPLDPVTKERGFGNVSGEGSRSLGRLIWRRAVVATNHRNTATSNPWPNGEQGLILSVASAPTVAAARCYK